MAAFVRLPDDIAEALRQFARERGVTVAEVLHQATKPKPPKEQPSHKLHCSFCGKHQREVKTLIAGPTTYICDECTVLSIQIIYEQTGGPPLEDWAKEFSGQAACGFAFEVGMGGVTLEGISQCLYCGARWSTDADTARAHALVCREHPMRAVERERDELREGLRRMALMLPKGPNHA